MGESSLVKASIGGQEASQVLIDAVKSDVEQRDKALMIIRLNPKEALTALSLPSKILGFSFSGAANALDAVAGEIEDPAVAQEMIEGCLRPDRRSELLSGRGDLPSTAAQVMGVDDLLAAILYDILAFDKQGEIKNLDPSFLFIVKGWMYKLHDHPKVHDLLDKKVGETGMVVRDILILAICLDDSEGVEQSEPVLNEAISHGYDEGVEPKEGVYQRLSGEFDLFDITEDQVKQVLSQDINFCVDDVELARKRLVERRQKIEDSSPVIQKQDEVVDEIDL